MYIDYYISQCTAVMTVSRALLLLLLTSKEKCCCTPRRNDDDVWRSKTLPQTAIIIIIIILAAWEKQLFTGVRHRTSSRVGRLRRIFIISLYPQLLYYYTYPILTGPLAAPSYDYNAEPRLVFVYIRDGRVWKL